MKQIRIFIRVFLLWMIVGVLSKVFFLLVYHSLMTDAGWHEYIEAIVHGLRLDAAVAGYLTMVPGLLLAVMLWYRGRVMKWIWKGYFAVTALLASLAYIANIGLYSYWGFPLDSTPLLYIKTSPTDALASMTLGQMIVAPLLILLMTVAVYVMMWRATRSVFAEDGGNSISRKVIYCIVLLVLTALLILPIRGGVGAGTNHTGSVYFSTDIRLNHAAVNPVFSFVESALHQEEIGSRYRFMTDDEATALFDSMIAGGKKQMTLNDSCVVIGKANVVLICLESFSDSVMHVPGVTPNLNKYAEEGISFRNFYANSFRTDRALVAIHSALPAQPTMSIMDIPRKSTSLPSIAGTLADNGYSTTFYYGGDINYSNMRSYFVGTGFRNIVSDVDFSQSLHTGKWGVADGPVYDRMLKDIRNDKSGKPFFRSIMTESSHEPFDVPNYSKIKTSPELNAFAYADECLGKFVAELKRLPCWKNTIVLIVPDHLGAYPAKADNYNLWRFKIPFVIMGGAIEGKGLARSHETIGSQIDIAATLLGLIGLDYSSFTYSKNLLNPAEPHFAFFTFPDAMGLVDDGGYVIYDNTQGKPHSAVGKEADTMLVRAKAYLQKLYDDIENIDKR